MSFKSLALPIAFFCVLSTAVNQAAAAQSNDYRITISNNSECDYWVFMEQRDGSEPLVIEKGEKSSAIILKESGHLYLTSPCAPARKITTTQIYPIPALIFSKESEGFSTSDEPKINAKDVFVNIAKGGAVHLSNVGTKQPWEKK